MIVCSKCGHQSEDGTVFCARCSAFLEWAGERVDEPQGPGPVTPQAGSPTRGAQPGPMSAAPSRTVATTLSTAVLAVDPGSQVVFTLEVRNLGKTVDRLTIEVLGDAAAWAEVDPAMLTLMPATAGSATIRFRPPRSYEVRAGDVSFGIGVRSAEKPEASVVERGVVRIAPFTELELELVPKIRRGRRGGSFAVRAANNGNVPTSLALAGSDPEGRLEFRFTPSTLQVGPGVTSLATVEVAAGDAFLLGSLRSRPFQITAAPVDQPRRTLDGTILQTALLPLWIPAALVLGVAALGMLALAGPFRGAPGATATPTQAPVTSVPPSPAPSTGQDGTPGTPGPAPTAAVTRSLVFDSTRAGGYAAVFRMDGGAEATQLTGGETDEVAGPCAGSLVFYTALGTLNNDIWLANFDRSLEAPTFVNLTATEDLDETQPAYSPASNRLLFTARRDGSDDIYLLEIVSGEVTRVTEDPANDADAAWSPNGSQIAFVSDRDNPIGVFDLYVMTADGSEVTRLTDDEAIERGPAWSPDGSRIAFEAGEGGRAGIDLINADGSGRRTLIDNAADELAPAWSPDGSRIAFQTDRDGNWEIYAVGPDGSGPVNLTNDRADDQHPSWCIEP